MFGDPKDNIELQQDIAASGQKMYEEAFYSLLNSLHDKTGDDNVCLSGGCIYNSVANGKILEKTPLKMYMFSQLVVIQVVQLVLLMLYIINFLVESMFLDL